MEKVKFSEVKVGDVLIADSGFTCVKPGPITVFLTEHGNLAFPCESGSHTLDGQRDRDGYLVGLYKA